MLDPNIQRKYEYQNTINFETDGELSTRLYDKRDDFNSPL
jgi:hypothetical protein